MRIWLVEPRNDNLHEVHNLLRQLEQRPDTGLRLLTPTSAGKESAGGDSGANGPDLVVIDAGTTCDESIIQQALAIGTAVVVVTRPEALPVLRPLAQTHPIYPIAATDDMEVLWFTLQTVAMAHQRQVILQQQVDRLQQRLNDRIIIERAKGVLIQCLGISEEEAYQRLRVLSRQQQRRMRDVAQTLLNTRSLFLPRIAGVALNSENETTDPGACLGDIGRTAPWTTWKDGRKVAITGESDYSQS